MPERRWRCCPSQIAARRFLEESDQYMKSLTIAAFFLIATLATTTTGQVKSVAAANRNGSASATSNQSAANATRVRVLAREPKPAASVGSAQTFQAHAKPDFNQHAEAGRFRRSSDSSEKSSPNVPPANSKSGTTNQKAVSSTNAPATPSNAAMRSSAIPAAASQIYRVGVRDVLDIQLADNSSKDSTLFTVLAGGVLDYPFAGNPTVVTGMTTSEIAALLRQRIKIFDNPRAVVTVRDYASHTVSITGFVAVPGTKSLRREAVPLYTVLAEAVVLPEAARATIIRAGSAPFVVDLKDANLSSTLIVPGDAIKVSGAPGLPTEFFFIGGEIKSPGQKPYHAGLTLTQAILASGGTTTSADFRIRVSRQGADGKLSTEEYNLRNIQAGKLPDPALQKGDRIEVTNAN